MSYYLEILFSIGFKFLFKDQIATSACPKESEINLFPIYFFRWWNGDSEILTVKTEVEVNLPIFLFKAVIATIAYTVLTMGQTLF